MVIYDGKKFLGKVLGKKMVKERCAAQRSHGIAELQDFERLGDAIFYTELFNPEVVPKMVFSTENGSRKTKVLYFHISRLQTVPNKQVLKNRTFFLL